MTATWGLVAARSPTWRGWIPAIAPIDGGWPTSEAFITFSTLNGQLISPYQDYSLTLTLPDLTSSRRLRLEIRPAFTNERTLKFYGIGNATPLPPAGVSIADTEYQRIHPTLSVEARYRFYKRFYLLAGSVYTQNWLVVPPHRPAVTGASLTFCRGSRDHRELRAARGRAAGGRAPVRLARQRDGDPSRAVPHGRHPGQPPRGNGAALRL